MCVLLSFLFASKVQEDEEEEEKAEERTRFGWPRSSRR